LEVQALIQRCDTIIQQLVSAEELEKTNYLKFYNRALEISIQAELNEKKKQ
jgi:elongation factor P--beta-lysine ligase